MKPKHLSFIMDGNRRWADANGVPRYRGHKQGILRIPRVIEFCASEGIPYCSFYAFSRDNWNRSEYEIRYLKRLMKAFLGSIVVGNVERDLYAKTQVRFVGDVDRFGSDVSDLVAEIEERELQTVECTAVVALGYSSRHEILEAFNAITDGGIEASLEQVSDHLSTKNIPDPCMIVRTGNTQRLSDFMLWQAAYSELLFVNECWPDFDEKSLETVLEEFSKRDRRFGS